jgi:hypothetical protein
LLANATCTATVRATIPWNSLGTQPCVVEIGELDLVIAPNKKNAAKGNGKGTGKAGEGANDSAAAAAALRGDEDEDDEEEEEEEEESGQRGQSGAIGRAVQVESI